MFPTMQGVVTVDPALEGKVKITVIATGFDKAYRRERREEPSEREAPAEGFDVWAPGNVSPIVAYLAGASCPFNGETFYVQGGTVRRLEAWSLVGESIEHAGRWPHDAREGAMATVQQG